MDQTGRRAVELETVMLITSSACPECDGYYGYKPGIKECEECTNKNKKTIRAEYIRTRNFKNLEPKKPYGSYAPKNPKMKHRKRDNDKYYQTRAESLGYETEKETWIDIYVTQGRSYNWVRDHVNISFYMIKKRLDLFEIESKPKGKNR